MSFSPWPSAPALLDEVVGANHWGTFGDVEVEVKPVGAQEASNAHPGGVVGAAKEEKTKRRGGS